MTMWTRLVFCAWLAACGSAPPETGPPGSSADGVPCEAVDAGTGYAHTLLRLGCDGALQPGRATWTVSERAVTLDLDPSVGGPRGAELVAAWPPLDEPPWRGHRVQRIVVLSGDRIRVEFADPGDEPERLFADPRLAGVAPADGDGDARDAIDRNDEGVVTRHDASIDYARSVGRPVHLVAFDRLYMVAFIGTSAAEGTAELAGAVGRDWIGWGAAGARRLPSVAWEKVGARCAHPATDDGEFPSAGRQPGSEALARPTVSYSEGDLPARQVAERLASAGMRVGADAAVFAELTGSRERLAVRPAAGAPSPRAPSDVATVIRVHTGPVHPCSLYGEALRELAGWVSEGGDGGGSLILVGEVGTFAIGSRAGSGS